MTLAIAFGVASRMTAQAPAPTSRTVFFSGLQTTLAPGGTQTLVVQLWDDPMTGMLLFSESQTAVPGNGITNAHIANGALSPAKISGTVATLGSNTVTGNHSIAGTLSATGAIQTNANVLAGGLLGAKLVDIALQREHRGMPAMDPHVVQAKSGFRAFGRRHGQPPSMNISPVLRRQGLLRWE